MESGGMPGVCLGVAAESWVTDLISLITGRNSFLTGKKSSGIGAG